MKQTEFEFGLNLFGVQTSLKILVNSPKFYIALIFRNLNLDGHTCMSNIDVPIQVTFDLVWKLRRKDLDSNFVEDTYPGYMTEMTQQALGGLA
jgi:hypothetical protein